MEKEEKLEYSSKDIFEILLNIDCIQHMFEELYGIPVSWRDFYEYVNENKEKWQEVLDAAAPLLETFIQGIEFDEESGHYDYYDGQAEDMLMGMFLEYIYALKEEEFQDAHKYLLS